MYDIQYAPGKHYFEATRREADDLIALKSEEDFKKMLPDAVTLCVIVRKSEGDFLLLFYEYRYPTGRFLLSPPAGIIDCSDKSEADPLYSTAVRELYEETGLVFNPEKDFFKVLNRSAFSTPGMSDESNAIVLLILNDPDISSLTDAHTEGTELFDGFVLADMDTAKKFLESGTDSFGNYYSIYTWQDLLYFVSDMWKQYI